MKVKELIQQLQSCDPDSSVWAVCYLDDSPITSLAVAAVKIDEFKRPTLEIALVVA